MIISTQRWLMDTNTDMMNTTNMSMISTGMAWSRIRMHTNMNRSSTGMRIFLIFTIDIHIHEVDDCGFVLVQNLNVT